jgi:hypothetical protein
MKKKLVNRLDVFAPISRVYEENGNVIVEGYAFVNEIVPGEGGIRLKRSAMVAATDDFLKYGTGALRAMHQPIAAGLVPVVRWDDKGAFIRAEVVDENEKQKTLAGVYKGFSVGVAPMVMRGLDVEKCCWAETSLVDRPKDPDSVCTVVRADGVSSTSIEIEVDDEDDDTSTTVSISLTDAAPQDFATAIGIDNATEAVYDEGWDASYTLWEVLYDIAASGVSNAEELARKSIQQFADYIAPMVAGNTMPAKAERVLLPKTWNADAVKLFRASLAQAVEAGGGRPFTLAGIERAETPAATPATPSTPETPVAPAAPAAAQPPVDVINRLESTLTDINTKIARLDELPGILTRVEGLASAVTTANEQMTRLIERVDKIEQQPVSLTAPIRFPPQAAAERHFVANEANVDPHALNRAEIQAEITRIETDTPKEPDPRKRHEAAIRLNQLKGQLSQAN